MTELSFVRHRVRQTAVPQNSALGRLYLDFERPILGVLAVSIFLLFWEGLARGWWADFLHPLLGRSAEALHVRPIFIASPSAIAVTAFDLYVRTGEMWPHLAMSAFEFAVSLVIAAGIGIPLGLFCGRNQTLSFAAEPLLNGLNAMPQVALLPLVVLWMGTGLSARIFIIALLMIVPILFSAYAGVRTIEPKYLKLAKSFSASERQIFRTIVLPASVPFLLAGIRLSIGRGMVGIVVGEIYGSAVGIGAFINRSGSVFQTAKVFVGVLTIIVAGLVLTEIVRGVEGRLEIWRRPSGDVLS